MQVLSFEQSPPLGVPLRFFLTATLFGVSTGLLLAWGHVEIFASRWTPAALAAVHLTTAGFMLQVMGGALFQFMPVAVGANLPWPRVAAGLIHPALTLGGMALPAGFLFTATGLLELGAVAAGLGSLGLAALGLLALGRSSALGSTVPALRLALVGLVLAALAGAGLVFARAGDAPAAMMALSPRHVGWALGGWGLGLLVAVAWQVVPMFQLTPPYHPAVTRSSTWALAAVLAAGALPLVGPAALLWGLAALAGAFAVHTLVLQASRRRGRIDATLRFWQMAMVALLLAVAAAPAGVVLEAGVFPAVMMGMLYKIVPFVVWLHLKNRMQRPPLMPKIIPEAGQVRHVYLHLAAVLLLLPAPWVPVLAVPGGILLAASNLWMLRALVGALRCYRASLAEASAPR